MFNRGLVDTSGLTPILEEIIKAVPIYSGLNFTQWERQLLHDSTTSKNRWQVSSRPQLRVGPLLCSSLKYWVRIMLTCQLWHKCSLRLHYQPRTVQRNLYERWRKFSPVSTILLYHMCLTSSQLLRLHFCMETNRADSCGMYFLCMK